MQPVSHIFVHTDNAMLFSDIHDSLSSLGYTVALLQTQETLPEASVVLAEIEEETIEACAAAMRHIQTAHDCPLVYITAPESVKLLNASSLPKAYGYVFKPLDEHQLEEVVQIAFFKHKHGLTPSSKKIQGSRFFLNDACHYDIITGHLYKDNVPVALAKKERLLMEVLIDNLDKEVSFETLIEAIWQGGKGNPTSLRSLVRRLRSKLGSQVFESIGRIGYRLQL